MYGFDRACMHGNNPTMKYVQLISNLPNTYLSMSNIYTHLILGN